MIKVGVIGATGYSGAELLRLLLGHPLARPHIVTSRTEAGRAVADLYPGLRGQTDLVFRQPDDAAVLECDVVFFATPNATAMHQVPRLLDAGVKVIDLSADFRLHSSAAWQHWYGAAHACPELLDRAVYGLPELYRDKISSASLVANPGCYPTSVILALLPALKAGVIDAGSLIADAKSGVSGAGRKAEIAYLHAEVSETFKAYSVPGHRHLPEIRQALESASVGAVDLVFTPHLVPMNRGIHATVYARLSREDADLQAVYADFYTAEPFVDVMPAGSHPHTGSVRGTNLCRIAIHRPQRGNTLVVLSVIDNLVKGAAGQALQNMNLMFGLDETAGLSMPAFFP